MLHRLAWLWGQGGCENNSILGTAQWNWLESELLNRPEDGEGSKPELFIVLSSIQIWSTNPAMEGWGQFPGEQQRLWNLLQRHYDSPKEDGKGPAPVIFLSGDVHHGEILGQQGYFEVTSSGMTHHCGQPKLYGRFCRPILETFHAHRHDSSEYYIGLNYGTLQVDWTQRIATVQVRNADGEVMLQVEQPLDGLPRKLPEFEALPHTLDGHLIPYAWRILWTAVVALMVASRWLLVR
jgi:hypothetical protein